MATDNDTKGLLAMVGVFTGILLTVGLMLSSPDRPTKPRAKVRER